MIVLGVDPDLHSTALALADEKQVYAVRIVSVPKKLTGTAAVIAMCNVMFEAVEDFLNDNFMKEIEAAGYVVVEGQELYLGGNSPKGKPVDLFNLACVTGAALCAAGARGFVAARPLPKEWKGQVPKAIHQGRTLAHYKIPAIRMKDHTRPLIPCRELEECDGAAAIKPAHWKHVVDAIGLALWGATKGFK